MRPGQIPENRKLHQMYKNLTHIETLHIPNGKRIYTRFGDPVSRKRLSSYRGEEYYEPGQIVGVVHWEPCRFGTRLWRFIILRTVSPSHSIMQQISGISPGVEILLDVEGKVKVKKIFGVIGHIEDLNLKPQNISPAYYAHLHQRITANQSYHRYTMKQHDAYLKEGEVVENG